MGLAQQNSSGTCGVLSRTGGSNFLSCGGVMTKQFAALAFIIGAIFMSVPRAAEAQCAVCVVETGIPPYCSWGPYANSWARCQFVAYPAMGCELSGCCQGSGCGQTFELLSISGGVRLTPQSSKVLANLEMNEHRDCRGFLLKYTTTDAERERSRSVVNDILI